MIIGPTSHKGEDFGGKVRLCHLSPNLPRGLYIHNRPLLSTPGVFTMTPVPMGPQTCWKSCATLPWRSWTFSFAVKFRPVRGSEFPVARGQRWAVHLASPRRSCTASVAATSRGCFRCQGMKSDSETFLDSGSSTIFLLWDFFTSPALLAAHAFNDSGSSTIFLLLNFFPSPALLATHAFNDSGSSTVFLLLNFFPSPALLATHAFNDSGSSTIFLLLIFFPSPALLATHAFNDSGSSTIFLLSKKFPPPLPLGNPCFQWFGFKYNIPFINFFSPSCPLGNPCFQWFGFKYSIPFINFFPLSCPLGNPCFQWFGFQYNIPFILDFSPLLPWQPMLSMIQVPVQYSFYEIFSPLLPSWQPMLSMIRVQVQHSFYQFFFPLLPSWQPMLSVLQCMVLYYKVLRRTTKYYSSTGLYYKVLLHPRPSKSRWPEYASNSTWELLHCRCPARKTLRHPPTFFPILARDFLIIACDTHGKTFSRNDLKQTKDPTDRFPSLFWFVLLDLIRLYKAIILFPLLLECWHARHLQNLLCMIQAWEKTLSLAACSQPKPSLGAPKNEASSALERQKCLRCCAEENRRCRGVSKHLRFPPQKSNLFRSNNGLRDATLSQNVKRSLTCFAAFPEDCQFCSHWLKACQMRETHGFKSMWKKSYLLSITVPLWCGYVEQKKWWTVYFG